MSDRHALASTVEAERLPRQARRQPASRPLRRGRGRRVERRHSSSPSPKRELQTGPTVSRTWPEHSATEAGHMQGACSQACITSRAVDGAVVVLDLLARAGVFGQCSTGRVRKASWAGVESLDLRMARARFEHVVTVKDSHCPRTVGAVTFESPVGMDQKWPWASRVRQQSPHGRGDHLNRSQLRITQRVGNGSGKNGLRLIGLGAASPSALVRTSPPAPTQCHGL
jgi:hypothetical protein